MPVGAAVEGGMQRTRTLHLTRVLDAVIELVGVFPRDTVEYQPRELRTICGERWSHRIIEDAECGKTNRQDAKTAKSIRSMRIGVGVQAVAVVADLLQY